ncbi:MAG TPA: hypothetical protein VMV49_16165 [Candidatus Deferrimicrobium sp.]|nr:hypothetical protein [Candidatus Deferrimicrobium sp.]
MPHENTPDSKLTSFEKGIKKRLSKERQLIEWIIGEYIIGVNSKWHSDNFPSTQLTKVVLNITGRSRRDFSSTHRLIREILKEWEDNGVCEYITTTKYAHCRKTKMIYHFPMNGLKKIKEMIIDHHIEFIKNWNQWERYVNNEDVMKTRENIIKLLLFEYNNKIRLRILSYS